MTREALLTSDLGLHSLANRKYGVEKLFIDLCHMIWNGRIKSEEEAESILEEAEKISGVNVVYRNGCTEMSKSEWSKHMFVALKGERG